MPRGGWRPGSGRKSRIAELGVANLTIQAIEEHYGSILEGFKALLATEDPSLVKFVWEHAVGKPKEQLQIDMEADIQNVQLIRLPDNGRDNLLEINEN